MITVVAVALLRADGRVCLQRRPEDKAHAGLWEFPGGKVEAGEAPESALVREISEELGLSLDPQALAPATFASGWSAPDKGGRPLVILLYTCAAWEGEPAAIEATAIDWFHPAEMAGLPMPPLDYPLAAGLAKLLATDAI